MSNGYHLGKESLGLCPACQKAQLTAGHLHHCEITYAAKWRRIRAEASKYYLGRLEKLLHPEVVPESPREPTDPVGHARGVPYGVKSIYSG